MGTINTRQRIGELDFLKGILILLVISFHLVYIGNSYPYLKQIVYTFHMPGFLLISGYLMGLHHKPKDFLRTTAWLAVPYLLLESGYTLMAALLPIRDHIDRLTPTVFFDKLFLHPLGPYWYLHTLILCRVVYYFVNHAFPKHPYVKLLLTAAAFFGFALLGLLSFSCACYFLAGAILRQRGRLFTDFFRPSIVALIAFGLLVTKESYLDKSTIGGILIVYCALCSLLLLHRYLPDSLRQATYYLGRNSLLLYLFSPIFTILCKFMQPLFAFDPTALLFWVVALALCAGGSLLTGWLIEKMRLGRFIFGKQKVIV